MTLLLSSCDKTSAILKQEKKKYPGIQSIFERCHDLWDNGYKVDVEACEKHLSDPKHKKGARVKLKTIDQNCDAIVLFPNWSAGHDVGTYNYKIVCGALELEQGDWTEQFAEDDVVAN